MSNKSDSIGQITIPKRSKGRQSKAQDIKYRKEINKFCKAIIQIKSRLDFGVSSRGWCYILEQEASLLKSEFDAAESLINYCRKKGLLPLDICAEDQARAFHCDEKVDDTDIDDEAESIVSSALEWWNDYTGISFWKNQEYYVQMLVEKVDLLSLFELICREYRIRIGNAKGWSDVNQRADLMLKFDLPLKLVPHVKLEFCLFLFFNSGMPPVQEDGNSMNCVA